MIIEPDWDGSTLEAYDDSKLNYLRVYSLNDVSQFTDAHNLSLGARTNRIFEPFF